MFKKKPTPVQEDVPMPTIPVDRRTSLLYKWKLGTMTYPEAVELRDILAQEASGSDEGQKSVIALGLVGLLLYVLTLKERSNV